MFKISFFTFNFQCPRGFKTPRGLKYHMALHTGIAAFHCGECGKAFITRDKLLLHQKSRHSNERPHACEWCGKGFLLAHKLAEHRRRVHTGEKPFKCNMCDQRFTDSRYVKYFLEATFCSFFAVCQFSILYNFCFSPIS